MTDKSPLTICMDFDGVIQRHPGTDSLALTTPVPGARDFVHWARRAGYRVVILSARLGKILMPEERRRIEVAICDWLRKYEFPPLALLGRKPDACVYVDDRGFRFQGPESWPLLQAMLDGGRDPGRWETRGGGFPPDPLS